MPGRQRRWRLREQRSIALTWAAGLAEAGSKLDGGERQRARAAAARGQPLAAAGKGEGLGEGEVLRLPPEVRQPARRPHGGEGQPRGEALELYRR